MMKSKKGQSALEFLTTYGWAFLVILIMIGALGYFGILNPTRYLPERCNVNSEFACDEYNIVSSADDTVQVNFVLSNALGRVIDVNVGAADIRLSSDVLVGGASNTAVAGDLASATADPTATDDDVVCDVFTPGASTVTSDLITVGADETLTIKCVVYDDDIGGQQLTTSIPGTGNKLKVNFDMTYVEKGKTLTKTIAGEVFATIQ